MSVMKEDGTRRLIQQILASLKVGKIAIMDKALNINSKNPVENGVITQAINGINNRLDGVEDQLFKKHRVTLMNSLDIDTTKYEFALIISPHSIYLIYNFELTFPDNEGTVEINAITGSSWVVHYRRNGNVLSLTSAQLLSIIYVLV